MQAKPQPVIDPYYNKQNFPHFICNNGNWDIYANADSRCAAIPSNEGEKAGCRASQYGNLAFVKKQLGVEIPEEVMA